MDTSVGTPRCTHAIIPCGVAETSQTKTRIDQMSAGPEVKMTGRNSQPTAQLACVSIAAGTPTTICVNFAQALQSWYLLDR